MPSDPIHQLEQAIGQAQGMFHRLVLLVGPAGGGKTQTLQQLAARQNAPRLNLNLELSRRLLDVPEKQRPLQVLGILRDLLKEYASDVIILDNLELLFAEELKQDPLSLMKKLARNQLLVAAWSGRTDRGYLLYADPSHREYRRYPIKDFLIVNMARAA